MVHFSSLLWSIASLLLYINNLPSNNAFQFHNQQKLISKSQAKTMPSSYSLRPTTGATTQDKYSLIRFMPPLQAIKGPVRYSSDDWLECLRTLPTSRILDRTRFSILVNTAWTTFLVFLFKYFKLKFNFPVTVHSILGSALSLLLVFRTNSSYDRFWEARKLWAGLVASVRDIGRLTSLHINKSKHERIAKLLLAYVVLTKQHLQGERVDLEVKPFLGTDELPAVQKLRNRPNYILKLLSEEFHSSLYAEGQNEIVATIHEQHFGESLHQLTSMLCGCERIVKQPIPLSYSRHTSRFLFLFMYSLPLVLIPSLGWLSVPTMLATFWSYVSVQEIGHFIEE